MIFNKPVMSTRCVVCGIHEPDSEKLANHYTEQHTQEILNVFDSMQPPEPDQPTKLPFRSCKKESFKPTLWCKDSTHALPFAKPMPECETAPQEPVFVCSVAYCDASYNSILDLVQHVVQQHKEIPVNKIECRCSRCAVVLGVEDFIRHHDQNLCLMCHVCKELFKSKREFQSHVAECVKSDRFKPCYSCGAPTTSLRCTKRFCVREDELFECKICEKSFVNYSSLLRHHACIHLQIREIECLMCGLMLQREDHLRAHMEIVHKDGRIKGPVAAKYHCPICEFKSFDIEKVGRHIREHFKEHMTSTQISSYLCTMCEFGSDSKLDLYYHMHYDHFTDKPEERSCVICDEFKTDSLDDMFDHSLKKHQTAYDTPLTLPADVKSFQCSQCSEELRGTMAMLEHAGKHAEAPQYGTKGKGKCQGLKKLDPCNPDKAKSAKRSCQCQMCGRQFYYVSQRLRHIANIHLRISCFECMACGKTFAKEESMQNHYIKLHKHDQALPSTRTRYHCPLCGFVSFDIEKVGRHIREHFKEHMTSTQISSYLCTMCEFGSDSKLDLYYHMHYDHFTDKPEELSCVICDEFKTDSLEDMFNHSLEKHQTAHDSPLVLPDGVDSFQCLKCHTQFRDIKELLCHLRLHPDDEWETAKGSKNPVHKDRKKSRRRLSNRSNEHISHDVPMKNNTLKKDCLRRTTRSTSITSTTNKGKCEICGYEASSKLKINKHIIDSHLGDGPYTCEHCNNVYQTAESLLEHLNSLSTTEGSSANNELTTYDSNHDGDSVDETEDVVDSDENSWVPESDSNDEVMSGAESYTEKYFE